MPLPGAQPTVLQGDVIVQGNLSSQTMDVPNSSVGNTEIQAGTPGNFIDPSKIATRVIKTYGQPNTTATTETRVAHFVIGATATILSFGAGLISVCVGAATITFDLKKNGTTILSGVISLTSSSAARTIYAATVSSPNLVVGDELEVVITATAGGGTIGTGAFYTLILNEDPF